jgi:hypothetical protein
MLEQPGAWSIRDVVDDVRACVVLTGEIDLDAADEVIRELRVASKQFVLPCSTTSGT